MLRVGLCCTFLKQPIKFLNTTATAVARLSREDALLKLSHLCAANAESLEKAILYCAQHKIGAFRINSQILPLKTHPALGYDITELPAAEQIVAQFSRCGQTAQQHGIRLSFHPDQFVVLNSLRPDVVESSLAELEYQSEVAEWVGADVVNIHGGGAYGNKAAALREFARNIDRLSARARQRLTVENDDKIYSPQDLLPLCLQYDIPLVYDVHHHRCLTDELSVEEATDQARTTWNREPLFHLSSPLGGWDGPKPERHHDYINPSDFPPCWLDGPLTVEVEAKAKELAVAELIKDLTLRNPDLWQTTSQTATQTA